MRPTFILVLALTACGGDDAAGGADGDRGIEPPVLTNSESPVRYPPQLFARRTEGTVVLRLFVDERGQVVADSARVVERSGHDALDSAALAAVADMRFSPASKDGVPFATAFLQPVHFRHPQGGSAGGS
jgi:periplasmic protein TonB